MTSATSPSDGARVSTRKRALGGVATLLVIAAMVYGVYWALVLNHYESTDNAYVQANVVQITPQAGGSVIDILADETDQVKAGQVLLRFDPTDARLAIEQAEAQLAQTVRQVRMLYASNSTLDAQIALREAELLRARSELGKARSDVARRSRLVSGGMVSKEEYSHSMAQLEVARSGVAAAESAVTSAREQLLSNQTLTDGIAIEAHPSVLGAAVKVREAHLALSRAQLLAPVDGQVAKRRVQLGERVSAGAQLMSVIDLSNLWVEANFKESQIARLRIGQPVELVADVYGGDVVYKGRIVGLGAGTGSAFSLLPAQNATGNWIKVVQRVPVRIAIDPEKLGGHPLRVGLSMHARVDVSETAGPHQVKESAKAGGRRTRVFEAAEEVAEAAVGRIIRGNLAAPTMTSMEAVASTTDEVTAAPLAR